MTQNKMEIINFTNLKNSFSSIENLALYLSDKKVTKYSHFNDQRWIFDTRPDKTSFSFLINKKRLQNKPLELFWKLFIYLTTVGLPEVSVRNKGKIRHSYTSTTLFEFLQKIHYPGNISRSILFTPEECDKFISFIKEKKTSIENQRQKLSIVQVWYQINKYLPSIYQLPTDPLRGKKIIEIFPGQQNSKSEDELGWVPIPINDALFITRESIKWVEDYGDDILNIHKKWIDYFGTKPKISKFTAFGKKYNNTCGRNTAVKFKLIEIIMEEVKKPSLDHPFYELWHIGHNLLKQRMGFTEANSKISRVYYSNVVRSLYGACLILILFSTGMRKSELYSLQRGCLDTISNLDIPLVENEVLKTDVGITKIPISEVGAKAIRLLEKLGKILSSQEQGPLLVPVERVRNDDDPNKLASVPTHVPSMMQKFCDIIGYGKAPHPHQFRHTLAAAVWERTEQAPVLLKILYNHSSLSMTLHYLRRNPIIKYAKKELFRRKYLPLVQQVVRYQQNNEIVGPASKRVKKMAEYIANSDEFAGKTEKELTLALEELFMSMIEQDQMKLFLTPFCVCMRLNSSASKSPCMLIEDHSDTVLATLPRTDRCVGSVCQDSLFTPLHQDALNESMDFYENYLDQIPEDMKGNVLIAKVAQKEIKKYQKINWRLNNA
ncbi:site-specific integrase [Sulfurimonas sp. NW7]|uniref:tyrosine-type recombinase/integrase n=1 Tax=Sulfurimonas sp. NW7 TaxID=2922727 RepID=UPI003DA993B8